MWVLEALLFMSGNKISCVSSIQKVESEGICMYMWKYLSDVTWNDQIICIEYTASNKGLK